MAQNKGGILARLTWVLVTLGAGALGCATQVDFLGFEPQPSRPADRAATPASDDAPRPEVTQAVYRGPYQQIHTGAAADDGGDGKAKGKDSDRAAPKSIPAGVAEPAPLADVAAGHAPPPDLPPPTELQKMTLPSYTIEPPDILFIDAIRIVPRPPYRIEPLDVLLIQVAETLPNQPIAAPFSVSPDGVINLGYSYGAVRVAGLTLEQAAQTIQTQLKRTINNPQVAVALAQFRGVQQTRGEHLVAPDGTITLGSYGCVHVTGLTVSQAKCVIEKHLSKYLLNPEISLNIAAYNSKVYYVIIDGGGYGQQVFRFPVTGNETVLDAISQINGLPPVSSTRKVWVARPTPCQNPCYEILPVNWRVLTMAGDTQTNYQVLPGDRIYVKANCLIAFNNYLTQLLLPVENMFGATLLGAGTVSVIRNINNNGNNGNNINRGF
jgi:polysaccharide export outer membrane protein